MLVHQGEGSGTPTEPHHTPFPEADTSHPTTSSIPLPSIPTALIPPVTQPDPIPIRKYSRRARIAHMQHNISELTALCSSLQRQYSELLAKFQAQEEEIVRLKERFQVLEDREVVTAKQSGDDAPIKGRSINEGEADAERISNDSEEIARVLTSIDAATVLAGGIDIPTGSGFILTAGPPATVISTGSESNETIAKYLQEYQDFALELPLEKRIELINDLVKYQDNYFKVYKFQSQQRRPMTKKQKREYYMTMIRNNLGLRVKYFKGMTFEEIEAKFAEVWKQVEDFIPMGS
nr:hypothetical protein [Tanacetum cinerariifolium]